MSIVFTGNKLKDEILLTLISGIKADGQNLYLLNQSEGYVRKAVSELKRDGYINVTGRHPSVFSLTKEGLVLIRDKSPSAYNFYMQISNNHRAGGTARHREIMKRNCDVLISMMRANINIGPEKPSLQEINDGLYAKMDRTFPTFFLGKEMRYADEQQEAKQNASRSCGGVFSPAIRALVYNTQGKTMKLSSRAESEANIRMIRTTKELYNDFPHEEIRESIVFCQDNETAATIFNERTKKSSGTKLIGDAVWDKTITGTSFRYIPTNEDGIQLLKDILFSTKDVFLQTAFDDEEIAAARSQNSGEAIAKGLVCYEYLSCNVSKLAAIKRAHANSLSQVGIVCWESQANFVKKFFAEDPIRLRVLKYHSLTKSR